MVPEYGIVAYPLLPVVIAEPAPSMVIPNEPDNAPPGTEPPPPPLPVSTVIGKVEPSPLVNVMVFKATDAVASNDPVSTLPPPFNAYEAVTAVNAYDAVCAKDAETAVEDDIANDAVPCKLPVTPCVTVKEPVIVPLPSERNPRFILNSFAISVHCPRLVILL